ncbi:protein CHUP1, chloroplastic [Tanacetum coccineum]
MAQENFVKGCSMKRPPLLEPNGFCFCKSYFETYAKSKDIDLWQVIQNGDFYLEIENKETKLTKETPYELLKYEQKKQLGKNNEVRMTLYNALPRKEYDRVFMCKTAKERAKVTSIEEAKDLATLPLDELVDNLKVYEMVLDNDGVAYNTTKEKVKYLALKAKVTREQTSDDSDSQGGSDEDIDEEEAEAFNLLARNFHKGNQFRRKNRFGNIGDRFGKGHGNSLEDKGGESLKKKGACYNCSIEGHFASEFKKPKENKAFIGGAWSDSEDGDEQLNVATCLVAIDSQENEELLKFNKDFAKTFEKLLNEKRSLEKENSKLSSKINDLQIEVKKLANDKEVVEPCKTCDVLTKEVDSLKCNVSKLQNEALNFSKFKESSIALDDMLSRQKSSQDKEGLGFSKNDKTTSEYDGGHVVFGSNLKGRVIGRGNITHDSITITNVEHFSGLSFNLISVVKGHRRNGLYTFKLGDNSKQQICLASVVDNSMLWHRRLGHANMRLVQNLASKEQVRNLPKLSFERHFCDAYGLGSQGNANTRTRKEVSTTRVLELLHLDLVGPSPIQSYRGNLYNLIIVDDHSNYTWVVLVESKKDVLERFKILCKA